MRSISNAGWREVLQHRSGSRGWGGDSPHASKHNFELQRQSLGLLRFGPPLPKSEHRSVINDAMGKEWHLQYRRRVMMCLVIGVFTASTLYLAGESFSLITIAVLFLVAGYLLVDAMIGAKLQSPFNTPWRLRLQQTAEMRLNTKSFVIIALVAGILFSAAVLCMGYLLSQ